MDKEKEQFEQIFLEYSDAIYRHLYYRLGNQDRAKELTQEVFMRFWQQLASGQQIVFEKAFLYKIAHNLFINEIRTDKTTYSLDNMIEETGFDVASGEDTPEVFTEHQELMRYLAKLTDSYKAVLVMRYIDGLPVKEIAKLLSESETNISMRVSRALDKLKEIYEQKT